MKKSEPEMIRKLLKTSVKALTTAISGVYPIHFQARDASNCSVTRHLARAIQKVYAFSPPKASLAASHCQKIIIRKKNFSPPKPSSLTLPFHKFQSCFFFQLSYFGPNMAFVHKISCTYCSHIKTKFGMNTH